MSGVPGGAWQDGSLAQQLGFLTDSGGGDGGTPVGHDALRGFDAISMLEMGTGATDIQLRPARCEVLAYGDGPLGDD